MARVVEINKKKDSRPLYFSQRLKHKEQTPCDHNPRYDVPFLTGTATT